MGGVGGIGSRITNPTFNILRLIVASRESTKKTTLPMLIVIELSPHAVVWLINVELYDTEEYNISSKI